MDGLTLTLGLALHNPSWDAPEIDLDSMLGIVEINYQVKPAWHVGFTHISGLKTWEQGYGLNMLTVKMTWGE